MRYKKEIIIAGAHALRREKVAKLHEEQRENFEKEEKILQQYTDDQPKIEEIAAKITHMAENGEEITSEFLKTAFQVAGEHPMHPRTLGLNKGWYDKIQKNITRTENEISELENEPLRIVDFLNAIEDDMVSDYGLKQAGFSINTSELVTKGLEEIRAAKTAERQAAEETA
jgi:hypothetical protein